MEEQEEITFGPWLRSQRRRLDLSRQALANQVGCAEITLRRIEAGSLKPSRELARLLLEKLGIPGEEQEAWIQFARGLSELPSRRGESARPKPVSYLPIFLTKFIGREKEQEQVNQQLKKNRLVTRTGPGGVGKTRLAAKVGEQVLEEYADGVWMVELAPLNQPDLVPQSVAGLFGMAAQSKVPYLDLLIGHLRTKNILIVLDNCEHLLEACARLAETLLKSCPQLKILATSREPLQILGEAVYQVPSLGIPSDDELLSKFRQSEAVRLFEERAQLSLSTFSLTMDNAFDVVQICRRLDGIPLAIELAAARVDILSVEQIAVRLHESFDLLTGGGRTALPRQQTIRGSMDWSWGLLSEEERILLSRLSVFSGGWTLDAAEKVCSGDGIEGRQVAELMIHLAAKSLIMVSREKGLERRYNLHEIVRQYAREKLRGEEQVRSRHLEYYLEFSKVAEPALYGPDQMNWVARLNAEMDNIRSAMDWAYKTDLEAGMYIIGGLFENIDLREGTHWATEFIKRPDSLNYPHARARALHAQANYLWIIEQFEAARIAGEEGLRLFQSCGDRGGEFGCLLIMAGIHQFLDGMDQMHEFRLKAYDLARSLGDLSRQAVALDGLGWDRRDPQRSNAYWDEAVAIYRQIGDWRNLAFLLGVYGDTLLAEGDTEAAHRLLEESEELNRSLDNERGMEFVLVAKSREALLAGKFDQAQAFLEKWLEIGERTGNRMGYLWGRARLGYVLLRAGNSEQGYEILCETAREFHRNGNRVGLAFTLEKLSYLFTISNVWERAAQLAGWANRIREETGTIRPKLEQADLDRDLAVCISRLGQDAVNELMDLGRAMTLDEAAALGLQEYESIIPGSSTPSRSRAPSASSPSKNPQ
ncbi:MAG: ATP-binding protein [Syntrophothermus sp.]